MFARLAICLPNAAKGRHWMSSGKRIGIYSGTFDPVHKGHVLFAESSLIAAHLDEVWWLVEPKPRNKTGITPLIDRRAMAYLALSGHEKMAVVDAPEETFTLKGTFLALQKKAAGSKLFFMAGNDVMEHFSNWPDLALIKDYQPGLIIGVRHGEHAGKAEVADIKKILGDTTEIHEVETEQAGLTSSLIRNAISVREQGLAPAVHAYINQYGLYSR